MDFLRARDIISGQEGKAYAVINGKQEEMFYVKNLEATVEKNKAEVRVLGRRGVQHKASGWSGTGSMTIYYVTSVFRELMMKYIKDGIDTYFQITVSNHDPSSSIGEQRVTLKNVNLNSVIMASLDTESDALEEEMEFTFEDILIEQAFQAPSL